MQVKCEYCGSYINDLDEKCPNCDALNPNYTRPQNETPRTIEQLKDWYRARNLPPEEVTRFFVGKDIREPKAFGIYEENGTFYVYKNKADGTRAIRYQGADEAYAVNELYMKLKEEILNQKRNNLARKKYNRSELKRGHGTQSLLKTIIQGIAIAFSTILIAIILAVVTSPRKTNKLLSHQYYMSSAGNLFYYSGNDWWNYDVGNKDWYQYDGELQYDQKLSRAIPNKLRYKDIKNRSVIEVAKCLKIRDTNSIDILKNRKYLDIHPEKPEETYYEKDGKIYYFLNDIYGSTYGTRDNTGWYRYDNDKNSWEYYSSYDDKEKLGDLYYVSDDYISNKKNSDIYDFSNTVWYSESLAAKSDYNAYISSRKVSSSYSSIGSNSSSSGSNSSWSRDRDWNWSSSDSWDSGSTDWDSDWD